MGQPLNQNSPVNLVNPVNDFPSLLVRKGAPPPGSDNWKVKGVMAEPPP